MDVTASPPDVSHNRYRCLRAVFAKAREGTHYYVRVEKRGRNLAEAITSSLAKWVAHYDKRFTSFKLTQSSCKAFVVYASINIGSENSSVYIHKSGPQSVLLQVEAETKKLWKSCLEKTSYCTSYLSSAKTQLALHDSLRKALRSFLSSKDWEKIRMDFGLKCVELVSVCKLTLWCFPIKSDTGPQLQTLSLDWISNLTGPSYCKHWLHTMYGDDIPDFIAMKTATPSDDPELIWSLSYHRQEEDFLSSSTCQPWIETLNTLRVLLGNDDILKDLETPVYLHTFLLAVEHFSGWFQLNYEPGRLLSAEHSDHILQFLLKSLQDALSVNFVPNFFNAALNILSTLSRNRARRQAVDNTLKVLLRGGCECCRERIHARLKILIDEKSKIRKKGTPAMRSLAMSNK